MKMVAPKRALARRITYFDRSSNRRARTPAEICWAPRTGFLDGEEVADEQAALARFAQGSASYPAFQPVIACRFLSTKSSATGLKIKSRLECLQFTAAALPYLMFGIELMRQPVHRSQDGALVALDRNQNVPFDVRRLFVILELPAEAVRAAHSSTTHQAIFTAQGAVTVELDNGCERSTLTLDSVDLVLCVHAGVWLRLHSFAPATVLVVAASKLYSETEYFDGPKAELLPSSCRRPWS